MSYIAVIASTDTRLIDPSTSVYTKNRPKDGTILHLVASDEFNEDERGFSKGMDKMWEAITKPDNTNEALQFCKNLPQSHSLPSFTNVYDLDR